MNKYRGQAPLAPDSDRIEQQLRIVAKIEELFSELDKGIESLKTARRQLEVYRQSVLKHAFEGKLTAQWREENKDKLETPKELLARIQKERAAQYALTTPGSGVPPLKKGKIAARSRPVARPKAKASANVADIAQRNLPLSHYRGFPQVGGGSCLWDKLWADVIRWGIRQEPDDVAELPHKMKYLARVANVYERPNLDWTTISSKSVLRSARSPERYALKREGDLLVVEGNGSMDQNWSGRDVNGELSQCARTPRTI